MSTLKSLRVRKKSIQAAHKITSAMELIAASKSRRAQQQLQSARPYASLMCRMIQDLVSKMPTLALAPRLLGGTGRKDKRLLIIATSDRGLCGSFNGTILRFIRSLLTQYEQKNQTFKLICIGKKGYNDLKRTHKAHIVATFNAPDKPTFSDTIPLAQTIQDLLNEDLFDVCTLVYHTFVTSFAQRLTTHRLIPYTPLSEDQKCPEDPTLPENAKEPVPVYSQSENTLPVYGQSEPPATASSLYTYEPHEEAVLAQLLPENVRVQLFRMLLENNASEQAARRTAMNTATRNAKDMIQKLDLIYNRTRQALITRELIEIISGAEAL